MESESSHALHRVEENLADVWIKHVQSSRSEQAPSDRATLIDFIKHAFPRFEISMADRHFWLDLGRVSPAHVLVFPFYNKQQRSATSIAATTLALVLLDLLESCLAENDPGVRMLFVEHSAGVSEVSTFVPDTALDVFGIAESQQVPDGQVGLRRGVAFPCQHGFDLEIRKANHADGSAHHCIKASAQVAMAVSQMIARKTDPLNPAQIELLDIHSCMDGDTASVTITGRVSALDDRSFQDILELIGKSVDGICAAYGLDSAIKAEPQSQAFGFNQSTEEHVAHAARSLLGENYLSYLEYPDITFLLQRRLFEIKPSTVLYFNGQDVVIPPTTSAGYRSPSGASVISVIKLLISKF
jgi:hypothetical protein